MAQEGISVATTYANGTFIAMSACDARFFIRAYRYVP